MHCTTRREKTRRGGWKSTASSETITAVAVFFAFCVKMIRLVFIFVPLFGFVLLGCFIAGSFDAWAQRPDSPPQPNQAFRPIASPQTSRALGHQRIREGTAFRGMLVFFRQSGDRTALYTVEGNQRYTCLENLAMERILTALQENPDRQYWRIDGEFTEFRGENFVLIRRAVIAPAPTN